MPRSSRSLLDDGIYHVLNRGNCRMNLFSKDADFAAFIALLEDARKRFPGVRILGYCLMHNHWHLALRPRVARDLPRFMAWLCTTHVRRWREHRKNVGEGHLYQGRYKSFLVQCDEHLLTLLCYIESNPRRAKMVRRAEDWPWSSLSRAAGARGVRVELSDWPVDRPRDWHSHVNEGLDDATLERIHLSLTRSRPFGGDKWLQRVTKQLGLEWTVRNPWRPTTRPAKTPAKRKQRTSK